MVASGELGVQEAARWVEAIQRDPESHVVAGFLNWKYIPTSAERAQWDIFEMELNTRRQKGKVRIRLDRPWQGKDTASVPTVAPDDPERLAALARLKSDS